MRTHLHQWTEVHPQIIDIKNVNKNSGAVVPATTSAYQNDWEILGTHQMHRIWGVPNSRPVYAFSLERVVPPVVYVESCVILSYVVCQYICVCKNIIFHVICTDASRVMKANSPTFQDHLVDQYPRISANPATQSVSNT